MATFRRNGLTRRMCRAGMAVVASAVFATPAAMAYPDFEFQVEELTTAYNQTFFPIGNPAGSTFTYDIGVADSAFEIDGSVTGTDVVPDSGIAPALNFTNLTDSTLEFIITMTMPMTTTFNTEWFTSAGFSVTSPGGELGSLNGMSLWSARIDGVEVQSIFDAPASLVGPDAMSDGPYSGLSGAIADSFSIQVAFTLSANATAGLTGGMWVVPAPGALALLAGGLFVGTTRRRRS